jgi:DNA gyrase subunit B
MIYRLMPTLLKAGKVYIAETPLFEIITKDNTYFAYSDEEKTEIISMMLSQGVRENTIKIQRSKGLGENDPEMMSVSTMRPDTRRLIPVEFLEDEEGVHKIFDALLGDNIVNRRFLIEQYFDLDVDID